MADSIGNGFPSSNIQIGHIFCDLNDGVSLWKYLGGPTRDVTSWVLINGNFNVQPDTSQWDLAQAGAMWFYQPEGMYYGWDGYQRVKIAFYGGPGFYDYKTGIFQQDDFLTGANGSGVVGALGWSAGAGSSTVSGQSSETNAPGIFRLTTTAVAGTVARLTYNSATTLFLTSYMDLTFIVRLNTNDTDTTCRIGIGNSTAADPPNHGLYFEKLTGDTNWFCVSRAATVETRTDSGVSITTTSFLKFRIKLDNGTVEFYINGQLVGRHAPPSANIPTIQLSPWLQIINAAAAAKTLDVDYFEIIMLNIQR